MKKYLFVCGCARSGTTVLRRLLVAHDKISIGTERYLRLLRHKGSLSQDLFEKERFFNPQSGDTFYTSLDHFRNAYRHLHDRYESSTYFGDKIPFLYRHYDIILRDFPGAKILFISRNLHDVALSYKNRATADGEQNWGSERDVSSAIEEWNQSHRLTATALDKYPGQIFVLNYEIIFGTWSGLDDLFAFLNLDLSLGVRKRIRNIQNPKSRQARISGGSLTSEEKISILADMDILAWRKVNEDWLPPHPKYPTRDSMIYSVKRPSDRLPRSTDAAAQASTPIESSAPIS